MEGDGGWMGMETGGWGRWRDSGRWREMRGGGGRWEEVEGGGGRWREYLGEQREESPLQHVDALGVVLQQRRRRDGGVRHALRRVGGARGDEGVVQAELQQPLVGEVDAQLVRVKVGVRVGVGAVVRGRARARVGLEPHACSSELCFVLSKPKTSSNPTQRVCGSAPPPSARCAGSICEMRRDAAAPPTAAASACSSRAALIRCSSPGEKLRQSKYSHGEYWYSHSEY